MIYVTDLFDIKNLLKFVNANNANNGNASQNIWDQMALFNQLTLRNILNAGTTWALLS